MMTFFRKEPTLVPASNVMPLKLHHGRIAVGMSMVDCYGGV